MNPRQRVLVGDTSLRVTRLGLGGAPLGGLFEEVSDSAASAAVEAAWDLGVRLFDTAPLYGCGLSERRIGAVLRTRRRDDFVLSTKVGRLLTADPKKTSSGAFGNARWYGDTAFTPIFDFSEPGAVRSLEESLERLGLDRIDIAFIHDPGNHYDESLNGAFAALDQLRSEGTIAGIGVGMNESCTLARFVEDARLDCVLLAGRYTILDQSALGELLPACARRGISVIAGGVYNSGLLADPRRWPLFDYAPASQPWIDKAQSVAAVCNRHDVPLKAAAIQFPLGHPAVCSVLVGCRSADEVSENVGMFEWEIPGALWDELRAEGLLVDGVPSPVEAQIPSDRGQPLPREDTVRW